MAGLPAPRDTTRTRSLVIARASRIMEQSAFEAIAAIVIGMDLAPSTYQSTRVVTASASNDASREPSIAPSDMCRNGRASTWLARGNNDPAAIQSTTQGQRSKRAAKQAR